jgi:hypothetical protein
MVLITLRWPEGPSFWELAYPFFAAVGVMGLLSTQFIGLSASTPKDMIATSTTGYYLAQQFGIMLGVTLAPAVTRKVFKYYLKEKLGTSTESLLVSIPGASSVVLSLKGDELGHKTGLKRSAVRTFFARTVAVCRTIELLAEFSSCS